MRKYVSSIIRQCSLCVLLIPVLSFSENFVEKIGNADSYISYPALQTTSGQTDGLFELKEVTSDELLFIPSGVHSNFRNYEDAIVAGAMAIGLGSAIGIGTFIFSMQGEQGNLKQSANYSPYGMYDYLYLSSAMLTLSGTSLVFLGTSYNATNGTKEDIKRLKRQQFIIGMSSAILGTGLAGTGGVLHLLISENAEMESMHRYIFGLGLSALFVSVPNIVAGLSKY